MTCIERDQNLLLLAHDALSLGERLQTLWHVRTCARCRARLAEFEMVSRAIAVTITEQATRGPLSHISIVHGPRLGFPIAWLVGATLFLVILAGVTATMARNAAASRIQAVRNVPSTHCSHAQPPPGCAPNLPNDHCR